jgi:hypothetical protein
MRQRLPRCQQLAALTGIEELACDTDGRVVHAQREALQSARQAARRKELVRER